jgi:predicted AAA+ superfamily ATPase
MLMNLSLGALVKSIVAVTSATPERPAFVFLDELTYAKDWDTWLKTFYDERWPVRIAGSSSSTFDLSERRHETGVGRWDEQYLAPYLFSEYLDLMGSPISLPVRERLAPTLEAVAEASLGVVGLAEHRRRFLLTGGFPELLLASRDGTTEEASLLLNSQRTLRADAIERAIYKDIPLAVEIRSPAVLERMLYVLASQVASILAPLSICRDLDGMSQPTFDKYLKYLERSLLIFTLPNYSPSEASVQRRGRKLYFVDGAIRNAALQRGLMPLENHAEMGLLLENAAASHLHALAQQTQVRLYHWREKGDEVDLVYDDPHRPLAFEIATSPDHHRHGLNALIDRFPRFKGGCYLVATGGASTGAEASPNGIGRLPLDLFLAAVGAQADRELGRRLGLNYPLADSTGQTDTRTPGLFERGGV